MSIKQKQSEAGVTGEYSHNWNLAEGVHSSLYERFDHTHNTVTNDDAYIFFAQVKLGDKISDGKPIMHNVIGTKGCQHNLVQLLINVMEASDYFKESVLLALQEVL